MSHINCTRCQRLLTFPPGDGPVAVTCPGCGKKMAVRPSTGARHFTGKQWAIVGLGGGAAVFALAVGIWLVIAGPSKEVVQNTGPAVGGPPGQGARGIGEARDTARRGPEGRKIAVLVGVNRYRHSALNGNRPLQYAENDVVELRDVLSQAGYTVHLLTGDRATLGNIRATLETARAQTADGGVFLVGLAGHGFQPEKSDSAYFCPYDADQRVVTDRDDDPWVYESMLPLEVVLSHLKASGAGSRVLMMDACRNDPVAGRGRGVGANLKISEIPNTAVLLSCSQGQKSFEDKAWGGGHGVFFHHVLTGLRGQEPSVIANGKIDLDLLVAYLKTAVPKQVKEVAKDPFSGTAPDQQPHRIVNGNVDLLIAAKGPSPAPKVEPKPAPPTPAPKPEPPPPSYRILPLNEVLLKAGGTATVDIRVERNGVQGPLTVELQGLPSGVSAGAGSIRIPAGSDAVTVTLAAARNTVPRTRYQVAVAGLALKTAPVTLPLTVLKLDARELVFEDKCEDKNTKVLTMIGAAPTFKAGALVITVPPKTSVRKTGAVRFGEMPSGDYECEVQAKFTIATKSWVWYQFSIRNAAPPGQKRTWDWDNLDWNVFPTGGATGTHIHWTPMGDTTKAEPQINLWTSGAVMKPKELNTLTVTIQDKQATWAVNGTQVKQLPVTMNGRGEDLPGIFYEFRLGLQQEDTAAPTSIELHNVRIWRLNP